jgi:hypothetical protein
VEVSQPQPGRGQLVKPWCLAPAGTVAAEFTIAEVIGHDQHDVGGPSIDWVN